MMISTCLPDVLPACVLFLLEALRCLRCLRYRLPAVSWAVTVHSHTCLHFTRLFYHLPVPLTLRPACLRAKQNAAVPWVHSGYTLR